MENKPNADIMRDVEKAWEKDMRPSIRVNRKGVFVLVWLTIVMLMSTCYYPSIPININNYDIQFFLRWRLDYDVGIVLLNISWAIGILLFDYHRVNKVGYIKLIAFWITYSFWLLILFVGPPYFKFLENRSLTPDKISIVLVPITFVILCLLGRLIFTED